VSTELRRRVIENLLRVRWTWLVHQPLGRIANTISNDATRAAEAYVLAATLVALMLETAIALAIAGMVSWKLAVAAVLIGALVMGSLHFLVRIARKAGWAQTQRNSELLVFLSDTLNNIKPIKAMAKQGGFASLMAGRIRSLRKALRRQVISKEI